VCAGRRRRPAAGPTHRCRPLRRGFPTHLLWRRGRALAESFVVTADGIGFGEGTLGVDMMY
jgi:hypothetical protein